MSELPNVEVGIRYEVRNDKREVEVRVKELDTVEEAKTFIRSLWENGNSAVMSIYGEHAEEMAAFMSEEHKSDEQVLDNLRTAE